MKFSILVPVYNVEKYLEQCVESLLSQTYKGEYEIILVDDGSTDSSGIICDEYANKYPDKIRVVHKINQGLISARDSGIAKAVGDYCLFVDSDDFVERGLLQVVYNSLSEHSFPDMFIYSFQYFENGKTVKRKVSIPDKVFSKENKNYFYEQLISTPTFTSLWTKVVKSNILKNDPTDYSQYYGKDMGEDWLRSIYIFTKADTIVCKNVPLYNYRINLQSISKSYSYNKICKQNIIHIYEHFLRFLPLWNMNDEEHKNKLKNRWLNEVIYTFLKFYKSAKNNKERKLIVDFDWSAFLPSDFSSKNSVPKGEYSCWLYNKIQKKQYLSIRFHFIRKSIHKKYKEIKSRILK